MYTRYKISMCEGTFHLYYITRISIENKTNILLTKHRYGSYVFKLIQIVLLRLAKLAGIDGCWHECPLF